MSLKQLSLVPPAIGEHTPDGAFKDWVTFYSQGTRNASDGSTNAPVAFTSCWAAIRALTASEQLKAQQISQIVNQMVTIKYQSGITAGMTVQTSDGRVFQIVGILDPYNTKVEIRITCQEVGQNAG